MTDLIIDTFALAYVEAALWSSTNEDGEPLDGLYTIDDIHADTLAVMVKDCEDFQSFAGPFIADREEQAGRDFWLTRNGHGAGFWDGDWEDAYPSDQMEGETDEQYEFRPGSEMYGTMGEFLTAMSRPYGSFDLHVGDDGMIHGS